MPGGEQKILGELIERERELRKTIMRCEIESKAAENLLVRYASPQQDDRTLRLIKDSKERLSRHIETISQATQELEKISLLISGQLKEDENILRVKNQEIEIRKEVDNEFSGQFAKNLQEFYTQCAVIINGKVDVKAMEVDIKNAAENYLLNGVNEGRNLLLARAQYKENGLVPKILNEMIMPLQLEVNNALDVSTMKSIIDNINIEKAKNSDLGHSPLFLKLADALVKKASDILKADSHSDEILRTEKGRYDLNKVAQYLTQKLPSFPAPEMAPQSADALSSSKIQAHTGP